MINNAIFRWFNRILQKRCATAPDVVKAMQIAEDISGISLDAQDPALADRIVGSLLEVSQEIADGKHFLYDDRGRPWSAMQKRCERSFGELCGILNRWNRSRKTNDGPLSG